MRRYHKIMMQANGIAGTSAMVTGLWFGLDYLLILGVISYLCVYLSYLFLKHLEDQ